VSIWSLFTQSSIVAPLSPFVQTESPGRSFATKRGLLLPMGGGYAEVLPGLARSIYARAQGSCVHVTVVPASFSTDAYAISKREREQNLQDAEHRRLAIEISLRAAAPAGMRCDVALAPIFVRDDAENKANLRYFDRRVDAVFLLGGDQSVAMRVLRGTRVERALQALYGRGRIVAGTSAGAGMQSRTMLAGFREQHNVNNSLHAGATAVWDKRQERGLAFGVRGAIFDQHFFQRGRLGRLLEAVTQPDAPGLGVGIDAYTGLHVHEGGRLDEVFGLYSVAVLDARSHGAAESAHQRGPHGIISLRNVLVHLLAPGPYHYDLRTRRHSLAPRPEPAARRFEALALPPGAGPLFLCGGLDESRREADAAWRRFLACGSVRAGIALIGHDPGSADREQLAAAHSEWLCGMPLWLEGAHAAMAGTTYCAGPAAQTTRAPEHLTAQESVQIAAQRALIDGNVQPQPGLGLLPVSFEPRMLENSAWGRLFALAFKQASEPVFALGANTTLAVTDAGAEVLGEESVIALDLRTASRALGDNRGYVIANGLLDVYAPGERVEPQRAFAQIGDATFAHLQRIPCAEGNGLFWP
jgi:cyanophycinase